MTLIEKLRKDAKEKTNIHLALPEGHDARIWKAARTIVDEGIARVTVLGGQHELAAAADEARVSMKDIHIVTPHLDSHFEEYAENYFELRKAKGMSREKALDIMKDPTFFGAMMLERNHADACISGAANATAHVVRAALQIVRTKPGNSILSSDFIMVSPDGEKVFSFADCAVMPDPTAEQLADIAKATADTHRSVLGVEPVVALLSFSTKGSANHEMTKKVTQALAIAKEKYPELAIDGELQLDAAIVAGVGTKKAPGSPVAGKANVLVFPDLNSGNIGYKLVQRLAGYEAIGPVFQGLNKPIHDLSRGCSAEDIVNLAAITALQTLS
jgi:phosphate acetyltransferase